MGAIHRKGESAAETLERARKQGIEVIADRVRRDIASDIEAKKGCTCGGEIERWGGADTQNLLRDLDAGIHYDANCPRLIAFQIRRGDFG